MSERSLVFKKLTIQCGWQNKHIQTQLYEINNIIREGRIRGQSVCGWSKLGGGREALDQWEEVIMRKSDLKGVDARMWGRDESRHVGVISRTVWKERCGELWERERGRPRGQECALSCRQGESWQALACGIRH